MKIKQSSIDEACVNAEKALNYAGYLPVVSTLSGSVRMTYAKIQIVASAVFAAWALTKSFSDKGKAAHHREAAQQALFYTLNGFANMFRASIEMVPLINLLTFLYDRVAHLRVNYRHEERMPGTNYIFSHIVEDPEISF